MRFQVHYRADTDLGRRFPRTKYPWTGHGYATRAQAEEIMNACPNAASMEIVEVPA